MLYLSLSYLTIRPWRSHPVALSLGHRLIGGGFLGTASTPYPNRTDRPNFEGSGPESTGGSKRRGIIQVPTPGNYESTSSNCQRSNMTKFPDMTTLSYRSIQSCPVVRVGIEPTSAGFQAATKTTSATAPSTPLCGECKFRSDK